MIEETVTITFKRVMEYRTEGSVKPLTFIGMNPGDPTKDRATHPSVIRAEMLAKKSGYDGALIVNLSDLSTRSSGEFDAVISLGLYACSDSNRNKLIDSIQSATELVLFCGKPKTEEDKRTFKFVVDMCNMLSKPMYVYGVTKSGYPMHVTDPKLSTKESHACNQTLATLKRYNYEG